MMGSKWDVVALGDVVSLQSGYAFKSKDWKDSGIPVVKIANVKNGRLELSGCSYVSVENASKASAFNLNTGDILIAMTGYIGDIAKVQSFDLPCVLNQRVGRFSITDPDRLDFDYLFYFLRLKETRKAIEALGYGSAQPNVSPKLIYTVKMPLPDINTQRRIASILGSLDDKIELNRRMNRTLERMAQALFKSWFIDFDPVKAKAAGDPTAGGLPAPLAAPLAALFPDRLEDSPLGQIPKGWEAGTLGDIANNPRRQIHPSEVLPSTPYIGLQHMPRRCIALDSWGRADEVSSGKSQFREGEILFGKLRPYFHKVGIAPVDGVCSTDILIITPKGREWNSYVLSVVSSKAFINHTDSHSAGTKMPRTNWKDMARFPLALPPESLAKAFRDHVVPFHLRIGVGVRQNLRLAGLRDTLLPKLLSGELEVPEAEGMVEEVVG